LYVVVPTCMLAMMIQGDEDDFWHCWYFSRVHDYFSQHKLLWAYCSSFFSNFDNSRARYIQVDQSNYHVQ
jgi:hypothetical protein